MKQRPVTLAANGMVATSHPLATAEGLHVLMSGGNAFDAVLTAAGVLGVVQPMMSGLGGDTFVTFYSARDRKPYAINGSGPAPRGLSIEGLQAMGHTTMPARGMLAVTIPGAVDVMDKLLDGWGSGRWSRARILAPAIRYAEEGAPVAPVTQHRWAQHAAPLAKFASSRAVFLKNDEAYAVGALHRQPDLARTLRRVAEGGAEAFYRGDIAEAILRYSAAHGGVMVEEDFATYTCEIAAPISLRYRDATVYTNPPPSQGSILLEALAILDGLPLERWGFGTAESVHALVEAKKLAYADRNAYFGDPNFVRNPLAEVLSPAFAARRRATIDLDRATMEVPAGTLAESDGDTTYLCAADRDGNMVSFISSLSNPFGCAEVIEGTGILLNNRGGRGFRFDPGTPNSLSPGRRTMHTLHPWLVQSDRGFSFIGGTPGGDGQAQWNLQLVTNVIDFGMDAQQALDAPRWESTPGTDPQFLGRPFELRLESGFSPELYEGLRSRGHVLSDGDAARSGAAEIILRDADGVYAGGCDARADGSAQGF